MYVCVYIYIYIHTYMQHSVLRILPGSFRSFARSNILAWKPAPAQCLFRNHVIMPVAVDGTYGICVCARYVHVYVFVCVCLHVCVCVFVFACRCVCVFCVNASAMLI